jgi:hypothetical protein
MIRQWLRRAYYDAPQAKSLPYSRSPAAHRGAAACKIGAAELIAEPAAGIRDTGQPKHRGIPHRRSAARLTPTITPIESANLT